MSPVTQMNWITVTLTTGAVLALVGVAICLRSKETNGHSFEAKWTFATSRDPVVTNVFGGVSQPVLEDYHVGGDMIDDQKRKVWLRNEGLHMIAADRMSYMLADMRRERLISRFLKEHNEFDAVAVTNAFSSIRYTLSGRDHGPVPIVEVLTVASRRDLADAVMLFWSKAYCDTTREMEQSRVDTALKGARGSPTELEAIRRRAESMIVNTYPLTTVTKEEQK